MNMKTFEQFKEELAYECMYVMNISKFEISNNYNSFNCCPLGSIFINKNKQKIYSRPPSGIACELWNITERQARFFIRGFSGSAANNENDGDNFYNLGSEYRKKFVK